MLDKVYKAFHRTAGLRFWEVQYTFRDVLAYHNLATKNYQRTIDQHVRDAYGWLKRSIDKGGGGGSAAHYTFGSGWSRPFPETTGYILPTLINAAPYIRDDDRIALADVAAYLRDVQLPSGGASSFRDPGEPLIFDTGMMLFGFIAAALELDPTYAENARACARFLCDHQNENGTWTRHSLRGVPHDYHARVAWALLEYDDHFGDGRARDSAVRALRHIVATQNDDGFFPGLNAGTEGLASLHFIAYTVQGLMEGFKYTEEETFLRSAQRCVDRLLETRIDCEVLRSHFDDTLRPVKTCYCLTGLCQISIVLFDMAQLERRQGFHEAAIIQLGFVKRHHPPIMIPEIGGGISGSFPIYGKYHRFQFVNWAAKFLIDACLKERWDTKRGRGSDVVGYAG